jgi:hypothetical protein
MSTHATPAASIRPVGRRVAYALVSASILAAIAVILARSGNGYWQLAAFAMAPDLALFLGFGKGLAKGQLHPRAVGAYNLLHRFWGPLALGALAVATVIPSGFAVGALAWAFHIALDRAIGYGLRTRDGFQRA